MILAPVAAGAQPCADTGGVVHVGFDALSGTTAEIANCACTSNCTVGFRCYQPILGGATYDLLPAGCNPRTQSCTVRATVFTNFPGNGQSLQAVGGGAHLDWFNSASANVGSCGRIGSELFGDQGNAWIQLGGFTCASGSLGNDTYTLLAQVCTSGCSNVPQAQRQQSTNVDLTLPQLQAQFCKKPPGGRPGRNLLPGAGRGRLPGRRRLARGRRPGNRRPGHGTRRSPVPSRRRSGRSAVAGRG
ncbi:MAG TPA: hypothetical protein VFC23_15255, partial [Thermoanaerobaculia bacterium]|nr:hypothetical protein [Thermoanaerobaculia bacterium]